MNQLKALWNFDIVTSYSPLAQPWRQWRQRRQSVWSASPLSSEGVWRYGNCWCRPSYWGDPRQDRSSLQPLTKAGPPESSQRLSLQGPDKNNGKSICLSDSIAVWCAFSSGLFHLPFVYCTVMWSPLQEESHRDNYWRNILMWNNNNNTAGTGDSGITHYCWRAWGIDLNFVLTFPENLHSSVIKAKTVLVLYTLTIVHELRYMYPRNDVTNSNDPHKQLHATKYHSLSNNAEANVTEKCKEIHSIRWFKTKHYFR